MATRLYLPATAITTAISPTPDAGWEDVTGLVRADAHTSVTLSDAMATVSFTDTNNAARDILFRQYVSLFPLTAGQTVTGGQALKAQARVSEVLAGNNLFLTVGIRVIASDGTTVRKTVIAVTADNTEATTTLTNRAWTGTSVAGNYTTVAGDFLVVEIGMGGDPANTGGADHDSSIRLGNSAGSDLPENDSDTTDVRPWVQLTDTLTFVTSGNIVTEARDRITTEDGIYIVTEDTVIAYSMAATGTTYAVTGTAAGLRATRKISANGGTYTVTGTAATLRKNIPLTASGGSYSITGTAATLTAQRKIAAVGGSYSVTGTDAALKWGRKLSADGGSYTVTGTDATLTYTPATGEYSIAADSGSYAVTGTAASLLRGLRLDAEAGGFTVSGTDASFTYAPTVAPSTAKYPGPAGGSRTKKKRKPDVVLLEDEDEAPKLVVKPKKKPVRIEVEAFRDRPLMSALQPLELPEMRNWLQLYERVKSTDYGARRRMLEEDDEEVLLLL